MDNVEESEFYPYYQSGRRIQVRIPGVGIKTGRVGLSQGKNPSLWLVTGKGHYELEEGSLYLGEAQRKTRCDCKSYLRGDAPLYHEEGGRNHGIKEH
jgi:hypothetical protein